MELKPSILFRKLVATAKLWYVMCYVLLLLSLGDISEDTSFVEVCRVADV